MSKQPDGTTDVLSVRQAYNAMIALLTAYWQQTNSDDIASFLSEFAPNAADDRWGGGDPAAWWDWLAAVQRTVMPDSPEIVALIQETANSAEHYVGSTGEGDQWYAQTLRDGTQFWVFVFNGRIYCAGRNHVPRAFDRDTGLSAFRDRRT